MKNFLCILFLSFTIGISAQNPELARKYFDDGEFDKAANEYQLLYNKFPYQTTYLTRLIQSYQKAGKFEAVEKLIKKKHPDKQPQLYVWLGYNYQLQKDTIKAKKYFSKAIAKALQKKIYVYQTGNAFLEIYRLDDAMKLYREAMKKFPKQNYHLQMGQIYAQKNMPEEMTREYLKLLEAQPGYASRIRYYLTPYIQENYSTNSEGIKQVIIEEIQKNPNPDFYRLLQWIYIQQKDYRKAFFQLRSLYKKNEANLSEIYYLAQTAKQNKKTDQARSIYQFLSRQNENPNYQQLSLLALLEIKIGDATDTEDISAIDRKFQEYLNEKWLTNNQYKLKILYADFLAFHLNKDKKALALLDDLLKNPLSKSLQAQIKMKKADIFLKEKQFNRALILYTQVQLDFPNNEIGYSATYKIARASFFKGDIDWAENQLKVLKTLHSDLIANDAIDLYFQIINNKEENDSTQTGLKKLAQAKFRIFNKNYTGALQVLDSLTTNFKGQLIYDDALWTKAQTLEKLNRFDEALDTYQIILDYKTEDLYKDDALFRMAKIYETIKENDSKAQELYKKIIIEYPASFWFTDAQRAFRRLRGDDL